MHKYPSIETVWKRDAVTNKLAFRSLRAPEVGLVNVWTISEKVNGTNIRVVYTLGGVEVRGRTDKAVLPPGGEETVLRCFPSHSDIVRYFEIYREGPLSEDWSVTFYGELYGPGINGGGIYSMGKRFRCFDLKLGEHLWTDDDEMRRVCKELNVPVVPWVGYIHVENGYLTRTQCYTEICYLPVMKAHLDVFFPEGSFVAFEEMSVQGVQPEGIVAKPVVVLLDKRGDRVMWKLTYREFEK